MTPLLSVQDLSVSFETEESRVRVVDSVSFDIGKGQSVGLVGESGCGKSVTAMSALRLIPTPPAHIDSGRILFHDEDLLTLDKKGLRTLRGDRIGMVFQEPMTSLNPLLTIGFQIAEVLRIHRRINRGEARNEAVKILDHVGVGGAARRLDQYPHELSGGLRQRVMIAMALICKPDLLIADEPTTALDVTIQAQILDLINDIQTEYGMSVLMITHDLGVVAEVCEEVVIMYAGRIVEHASTEDIFDNPAHPYTAGLLSSIPNLGVRQEVLPVIPGIVPSPANRVSGCQFADRCDRVEPTCIDKIPPLNDIGISHQVACFNPLRSDLT